MRDNRLLTGRCAFCQETTLVLNNYMGTGFPMCKQHRTQLADEFSAAVRRGVAPNHHIDAACEWCKQHVEETWQPYTPSQ